MLVWIAMIGLSLSPLPAQGLKRFPAPNKARQAERRARMVERFNNMSPEQQDRALKKLPPERREEMERNLNRYRELDPKQKERLRKQFESFQQLPPERQALARKTFREMNQLPHERKVAVRRAVASLRKLSEDERKERLSEEGFKQRFSSDELRIVEELSSLPPPKPQ